MKSLFIKSYIPNAHKLSINLGSSIDCYENNDLIYVLVNSMVNGPITEELKDWIKLKLDSYTNDIFYVSMFKSKFNFAQSDKEIAWGTYAWFEDAPKHYIHFDNDPIKKLLIKRTYHNLNS